MNAPKQMPIPNRAPTNGGWSTVRRILAALTASASAVLLALAYTLLTLKPSSRSRQRAEIPLEKASYASSHNGKSTPAALELKDQARHEHSAASRLQ